MADDEKKNGSAKAEAADKGAPDRAATVDPTSSDARNVPGAEMPTEAVGSLTKPASRYAAHPASNVGLQDRQRLSLPVPKSDVMGDTAVHNAGNAGPIAADPSYAPHVKAAPLPAGLLPASPEKPLHSGMLAPPPTDPGLVAHSGMAHGMTAAEDAQVAHLTLRFGELRNALRDVNPATLGEGDLKQMTMALKGVFGA